MTDKDFEARVAAGDLPPLPEGPADESEALARMADRLSATPSTAPAGRSGTPRDTAPGAPSFRRSEAYLAGQIARAVARGQRVL